MNNIDLEFVLGSIVKEWNSNQAALSQYENKALCLLHQQPLNYEHLRTVFSDVLWEKTRPFCRAATYDLGIVLGTGALGGALGGVGGLFLGLISGGIVGFRIFGVQLHDGLLKYDVAVQAFHSSAEEWKKALEKVFLLYEKTNNAGGRI